MKFAEADACLHTGTKSDIFVTYTFGRGRLPEGETKDEVIQKCKNIWKYYRAKLRNYYRSQNAELKYMYAFSSKMFDPTFTFFVIVLKGLMFVISRSGNTVRPKLNFSTTDHAIP